MADGKPTCGLLALLPKPKGATTTTTAAVGGARQKISSAENASPYPNIPKHFLALKPRQLPTNQQQQGPQSSKQPAAMVAGAKASAYHSDSDDEEFEQKLAESRPRIGEDDEEEEGDDDMEMMMGPRKPPTQSEKILAERRPQLFVDRPLLGMDYGSDDSDEEEEEGEEDADEQPRQQAPPVDFFGFNNSPKRAKLELGNDGTDAAPIEPAIFFAEVAPGPARPTKAPPASFGQEDSAASSSTSSALPIRPITDQEASRMIYERELAPFGASSVLADDAVHGMLEVSVDAALGPNVRENLLKSLNNKQMAQIAVGPLPKVMKSETDRLSKRKHQITHLAQVAVSREEQLQEKWADSKQNKKMSRQKYGF